ncbi:hypothetical protein [Neobacillus ginsengisoli]|uniref:Uncharacterized protein n=1 Tax=Neobacillus ginsengisoli TaxID=904295 RepID=A0ABT9Y0E8_9BACI|nr:hypothetical protein [Neobacillus ginsengisoli]MDQ0201307.1 hypothetical protein [Neobacillus ginsengisoli]
MNYVFIVLVEFYPSWLAMTREERGKRANELKEVILKYPEVQVRFFDAEALPGKITQILFFVKQIMFKGIIICGKN